MLRYIKIISLSFILLCFGCSKSVIEDENVKKDEYTDDYIETIPSNALKFIENLDNSILLEYEEISKYNDNIKQKSNYIYDLNINNITKEEILKFINSYKIPNGIKYNDNNIVNSNQIKTILDNRNIEYIKNTKLIKGITINRTNLKSFPTDIHFYSNNNLNNFDSIQETELTINTPVLILHESKDKNWNFVMSPLYVGWVKSNDIVVVKESDWNYFTNNKNFVIITEPSIKVDNIILDMGVKIPFNSSNNNTYKVIIPTKDKNGYIKRKQIELKKTEAHIGYLPFTKRNIYIQSFKYENIPYSWGEMDIGIDCSSFIVNVFKTFGFIFPRNVAQQRNIIGEYVLFQNESNSEKLNIISNNNDYPYLIFEPNHVMIYLGIKNNNHYIIHASGYLNELKVVIDTLENSDRINKINKIVKIKI